MPKSYLQTSMLIYQEDAAGLILEATIQSGTPLTTASLFAKGALVTCLDDGKVYRNSGTSAVPVWEDTSHIDSDEIDVGLIRTVEKDLTSAQIKAMMDTPVEILAGPSGKAILVESVDFIMTRAAGQTGYTGGGVVNVQYKNTATGAGVATHADIAATIVAQAEGITYTHRIGSVQSSIATADIVGQGLYISNKTAPFTDGQGTAKVVVRYYEI